MLATGRQKNCIPDRLTGARKCEPRYGKTSSVAVRSAKTQISLGIHPDWSESSLSAWRKLRSSATHWAHCKDWSDWANAQADLSLWREHSHFVGFVVSQLMSFYTGSVRLQVHDVRMSGLDDIYCQIFLRQRRRKERNGTVLDCKLRYLSVKYIK